MIFKLPKKKKKPASLQVRRQNAELIAEMYRGGHLRKEDTIKMIMRQGIDPSTVLIQFPSL